MFFSCLDVEICPAKTAFSSVGQIFNEVGNLAEPILVLQYPERNKGRTIPLAATGDRETLVAFKKATLSEARMDTLRSKDDEVLRIQAESEMRRLEALLDELIPDAEQELPNDVR